MAHVIRRKPITASKYSKDFSNPDTTWEQLKFESEVSIDESACYSATVQGLRTVTSNDKKWFVADFEVKVWYGRTENAVKFFEPEQSQFGALYQFAKAADAISPSTHMLLDKKIMGRECLVCIKQGTKGLLVTDYQFTDPEEKQEIDKGDSEQMEENDYDIDG